MLNKIAKKEDLKRIESFFKDIRFYMGKSVLQETMGDAFVDDINNPKFAILKVKKYCFISGDVEKETLKNIIDESFKDCIIIPSDNLIKPIEKIYADSIVKKLRYSIKKDVDFDVPKLEELANSLQGKYELVKINEKLGDRIKSERFINITDDYENYGIGYCCMHNNEIIGVASSNIFYKDGIEVNIRVKEEYRRQGIATAMAASLILECLRKNKEVSWDASNLNSLGLAKKLGFEYDSAYSTYRFE